MPLKRLNIFQNPSSERYAYETENGRTIQPCGCARAYDTLLRFADDFGRWAARAEWLESIERKSGKPLTNWKEGLEANLDQIQVQARQVDRTCGAPGFEKLVEKARPSLAQSDVGALPPQVQEMEFDFSRSLHGCEIREKA